MAGDDDFEVSKTDEEWKAGLSPEQYDVLRRHGTEGRGSSPLNAEKRTGTFHCAGCGEPLFPSETKYESGSGWPSFFAPIKGAIGTTVDRSHLMTRTEVHCRRCGGHLGHVFEDGPAPTGLRFCMNGAALAFEPKQHDAASAGGSRAPAETAGLEQALFGMGCFWGAERKFWQIPGVRATAVGYAGGRTDNPTYRDVCSGQTGHAEVVQVEFDPARVTYRDLLKVFWENHDPTQGMRQGNDIGTQYRSVVFTYSDAQRKTAEQTMAAYQEALAAHGHGPITTEIRDAPAFFPAEDYHQRYLAKNPNGYCGIGGTGVRFG